VPYLVFTTKTEGERRSAFLLLITLSVSQLLWGLLRAYVLYDMTFSAYEKWLSGFGSLALLYGALAYAAACREQLLTQGKTRRFLVYSASTAMILIAGARAVWFAAAGALILLAFRRQMPVRHLLTGGALLLLIVFVVFPLFLQPGLQPGDFLRDRLLAFTDFTTDPTAAWRYTFWVASLEEIMKSPWLGHGFGLHFNVYVAEFRETLTTSPHNLYLSMTYQTGILGLILYLAWILVVALRLKKHRPARGTDNVIVGTAILVLLAIHAYGIAYSLEKDFFTWSYVGLGISSMVNAGQDTPALPEEEIT
jgi:O-antigen ligase